MPPKKKHDGVLSCDPSFKGMAFALYLPSLSWQDARCYDIRENRKIYDTQEMTRELVHKNLLQLFEDMPLIEYCSIFVIEGQFKKKMIRLQESVCNQIRALLPNVKIVTIAAYSTRNYFGTNTDSYYQNKKESINFLKRNPQLLLSELWVNNDNVCEAIILLNHLVQKQALEFSKSKRKKMSTGFAINTPNRPDCPTCKQPAGMAESTSEKNPGRLYWRCENRDCSKWQEKKSFLAFFGEENKIGKWTKQTNKRPIDSNPNVNLVPAAKRTEPPQVPEYQTTSKSAAPQQPDQSLMLFANMIRTIVADSHKKTMARFNALQDAVDLVMKRTEKLDHLELEVQIDHPQPENAGSLMSNEKLSQSYGVTDMWCGTEELEA